MTTNNLTLVILAGLILLLVLMNGTNVEKFSQSGLNMDDRYCNNLVDGYFRPGDDDPENRLMYRQRICSPLRRAQIDGETGNYFTHYGKFY
jgi:hypothetical protein